MTTLLSLTTFGIVLISLTDLVTGAPEIQVFDKVATLSEGTTVNQILSTIECVDPDGDPVKAVVQTVSPSSPCGNCFEVLDCGGNDCLEYRAGVGTLRYSSVQSYLVTISCADNNELPATEVIEVKIRPNTPPVFQPDILSVEKSISGNSGSGELVHQVQATDVDNDDVEYTMEVIPSSSRGNYEINPITGEIRTTVDLRTECTTGATFRVFADDGSTKVGPLIVALEKTNANVAPVALNLDTIVQVPEDKTGTAYTMTFVDGNGDDVEYTVQANNPDGLAQFDIDGKSPNIDIDKDLDYEDSSLRQTNLVVKATDGFCESEEYSLRLLVTDVNEKPEFSPEESSIEVCEGMSEFDPGYTLRDEDQFDTHTYQLSETMGNVLGYFGINPATGALKTTIDYNVDQEPFKTTHNTRKVFVVEAVDKGKLTATATVTVSFLDCNDNPPVFDSPFVTAAATECEDGGAILGTVNADDYDSAREQNNEIYYTGSGGAVSLDTGGQIILNNPLPAGNVITFEGYAWDKGQTPGPLRSVNPVVISVTFTECPTPPPTVPPVTQPVVTQPAVTQPPATTAATTTPEPDDDGGSGDDVLPWIIIAALLGALMLGLLGYMLWRYSSLCLAACRTPSGICAGKPKPRKIRPAKVRRQPIRHTPQQRPMQTPPESPKEPEPLPKNPGFIFGFWKERYPDDDFKRQPDRKRLPTPGDMEAHYPHTYDPVDAPEGPLPQQPQQSQPAPAGKSKSFLQKIFKK